MKEYKEFNEFCGKISTTFRWWRIGDNPINNNHIEDLEDHAKQRILQMSSDGFTSGELLYEIDDVEYVGWFETEYLNSRLSSELDVDSLSKFF